jgi:hypothetical protein
VTVHGIAVQTRKDKKVNVERVRDTHTGREGWLTRSAFTNTMCVEFDGAERIVLVDEDMSLEPVDGHSNTKGNDHE